MPGKKPLFSDLVRDSKIETESLGSYIQHVFHEAGRAVGERLVRREERWLRQRYLGQGTYGTVYLEKQDGEEGKLRAVKEVKKFVVLGQELDYARELEAIMKFSHPKYKHCFVSSKGWYELQDSVFITMEFLELGDLQRYLTQPLPEPEGKQITEQILEGLGFMHDNGFIHRDLKPANVMVVTRGPKWFVKIADFGISKRRQQDVTTMLTLQRGTLGFAAPEALGAVPDNSYTFSVDMWSLGAVAYRILTNNTAFQTLSDLFQYAHGMIKFPEAELNTCSVSTQGQAFITNLMQPCPGARLSAAAAMKHAWMTTQFPELTSAVRESEICEATAFASIENTMTSVASKAWSTGNSTMTTPEPTVRPESRSVYQPPSVSDCVDDVERSVSTSFLANSEVLLEEANAETYVPSQPVHDAVQAQELTETADPVSTQDRSWGSDGSDGSELSPYDSDIVPSDSDKSELLPDDYEVVAENPPESANLPEDSIVLSSEDTLKAVADTRDIDASAKTLFIRELVEELPSPSKESLRQDDQTATLTKAQRIQEEKGQAKLNPRHRILTVLTHPRQAIERLSCMHFMCHLCLLQRFALSLLSPKYMLPRCCEKTSSELTPQTWGKLLVDPRLNAIWTRYYRYFSGQQWTCPSGHSADHGSLLVTKGYTPIWKQSAECGGCIPRLPHGRVATQQDNTRTWWCIHCSARAIMYEDGCQKCHADGLVWKFVLGLERRGTFKGWISRAIDEAKAARAKSLSARYQSFHAVIPQESLDNADSDSGDFGSESEDGDSDPPTSVPPLSTTMRASRRYAPKAMVSRTYDSEDVQYTTMPSSPSVNRRPDDPGNNVYDFHYEDRRSEGSGRVPYAVFSQRRLDYSENVLHASPYENRRPVSPRYEATGQYASEPQRYRTVTCNWCNATSRKPLDVKSDVLGPYATCKKCRVILICQQCRRPITKGFLCECAQYQGSGLPFQDPLRRTYLPSSDEDARPSSVAPRRSTGRVPVTQEAGLPYQEMPRTTYLRSSDEDERSSTIAPHGRGTSIPMPSTATYDHSLNIPSRRSRRSRRPDGSVPVPNRNALNARRADAKVSKLQTIALGGLAAVGATGLFRSKKEDKAGRLSTAAVKGKDAAETSGSESPSSYSDSTDDEDFSYWSRRRGRDEMASTDRLAHFQGETNKDAKLHGMRLGSVESWRQSLPARYDHSV